MLMRLRNAWKIIWKPYFITVTKIKSLYLKAELSPESRSFYHFSTQHSPLLDKNGLYSCHNNKTILKEELCKSNSRTSQYCCTFQGNKSHLTASQEHQVTSLQSTHFCFRANLQFSRFLYFFSKRLKS